MRADAFGIDSHGLFKLRNGSPRISSLSENCSQVDVSFETVGNQAGDLSVLSGFPGSDTRVLLVDGVDGKMGAKQLVVPLSKALVTTRLPLA